MATHTLSQLLDAHLDGFLDHNKLPLHHIKTLKCYRACRTAAMGSHSEYCENGHLMGVWYDSCKRRGCPQCRGMDTERWLQSSREILLQETHHHWIFTLPHELLDLWRYNKGAMQDILFRSVADTLKQLAQDKQWLGAQPGYLLALHTWGRNLSLHPHIHCLITHGGLDRRGQWQTPKKKILLPAKIMMKLFRGKFLAAIRNLDTLALPPSMKPNEHRGLALKLARKDWVVHCCKPYQHGRGVVTYLARYVKKGPFNLGQISLTKDQRVGFSYQDHKRGRSRRCIDPDTFIKQLCLHIAERGKPTLRYYGLYHPCRRKALNQARAHFDQPAVAPVNKLHWTDYLIARDQYPTCPICEARLALPKTEH